MIPIPPRLRKAYTPPEVETYALQRRFSLIQCASLEQPDGLELEVIEDEGEL
ncbi:MAG: hypothetical protein SPK09_02955 [Porphyromonas sp.]|nr:hypothetical protein [Porphyromonas sp.]